MSYLHNYSREDLEEQIQLYTAYEKQLAADVTSIVMIDGAVPHVRIYTKRDAGRRALYRVANNISDLADCEVTDSSVKIPKRQHEHYTSQEPEGRFVVQGHDNGVVTILTLSGKMKDATKAEASEVAIYRTRAIAESSAAKNSVKSYKVWAL